MPSCTGDKQNFKTLKNAADEVATLQKLTIEKEKLRKPMDEHKATASSLQKAHDRLKVKLQQREVKAPRGRPAAAAASSASLYGDEMESTSQVLESDSDEEARGLCRSP